MPSRTSRSPWRRWTANVRSYSNPGCRTTRKLPRRSGREVKPGLQKLGRNLKLRSSRTTESKAGDNNTLRPIEGTDVKVRRRVASATASGNVGTVENSALPVRDEPPELPGSWVSIVSTDDQP